jgi:aspartate ammonia-lyase
MDLNVMMPVINFNLQQGIHILTNAITVFTDKCVKGITVDRTRCAYYFEASVGMATILNPHIGYAKAAELAKESVKTGKTIVELIREQKILTEAQLKEILDPMKLTEPDLQPFGSM